VAKDARRECSYAVSLFEYGLLTVLVFYVLVAINKFIWLVAIKQELFFYNWRMSPSERRSCGDFLGIIIEIFCFEHVTDEDLSSASVTLLDCAH